MADDFPDLDQANKGGGAQENQSKANSAMIFTFGAATTGARGPEEGQMNIEERKAATKPVFRGKARLGGASNEEVQNSRMNYDFSRMNMSAATTGKREEGQDG
jgi:hypothetical protein